MARCELTVHLENDRDVYTAGDTVRGTVEVRTHGEVPCGGLEVACVWRTDGKGTVNEGGPVGQRLFKGVWPAGAHRRYPFALELPQGPFSYRGRTLDVGWVIRAKADIPRVRDRQMDRDIAVRHRGEAAPQWAALAARRSLLPPGLGDLADASAAPTVASFVSDNLPSTGVKVFLAAFAFSCALMIGLESCRQIHNGQPVALDFIGGPMLVLWGICALALLPTLLAGRLVEKKLGPIRFEVEPSKARRGETLKFRVAMAPRKTVELKRMSVRLEGREKVILLKGTDPSEDNRLVREKEVEIAAAQVLSHHIPYAIEGEIQVPKNAPASFYADQNTFEWSVVLVIDVARWPKWSKGVPVLIHP